MIIPDANLLIYAYNAYDRSHAAAAAWWESTLDGEDPVGIPWIVASSFIRIMTHPRILREPMSPHQATTTVKTWLEQPNVTIVAPGSRFPSLFFALLDELGTAGDLTSDAQIAALVMEHQATLFSNDTDFHRFPGLRWKNPLL